MSAPARAGANRTAREHARRYGDEMAIQRNSAQPAGITNASGQPEIVLELDGLVLSMTPPAPAPAVDDTAADDEGDKVDER
jgi:hypothetical protein